MTKGTVQREQVYVYGTCSSCSDTNVLVYEIDDVLVCANDYRKIVSTRNYIQHCDKCDSPYSVRDPDHRRNEYLCLTCHAENGFKINNSVVKRSITSLITELIKKERVQCAAAGYGSDCDNNVKPRSAWEGRSLCNVHGKKAPKKEKKS